MRRGVRVAAFSRLRIREILTCPDAWGRPEAVEFQILLLVEILLVADDDNLDSVAVLNERYLRYLNQEIGGPENVYLADRLKLTDHASEAFISALRGFVASVVGALVVPAVTPPQRRFDRPSPQLAH